MTNKHSTNKQFTTTYLTPQYYDQILKKYSHHNIDDLEILAENLRKQPHYDNILELGCGSGRATKVILNNCTYNQLTLTDLSSEMLDYTKNGVIFEDQNPPQRSTLNAQLKIVPTDHLQYLMTTQDKYDLVVSLWSLGHSIDPWYLKLGENAETIIKYILKTFIIQNLNPKGRIFFIHTDWQSEEQLIRRECRQLNDPNNHLTYYKFADSPSVRICKEVFTELVQRNILDGNGTKATHLLGDEIKYDSIDEALEVFLNFHMEGEFNNGEAKNKTEKFLVNKLQNITRGKGSLSIGTGFWVFEGEKS